MVKQRGIIVMGIILSVLSVLGLTGCDKDTFKPAEDAVITGMSISYSGMMNGSQYHFSLRTVDSEIIFDGEYYTTNDEGSMTSHIYEEVTVDSSYIEELRKLAERNNLVDDIKKYRKRKQKFTLLDGNMKYTTITMSDGSQKSAEAFFEGDYHSFFLSIVEAYAASESEHC